LRRPIPDNETGAFWVGTEEGGIYVGNRFDRAGQKSGINAREIYKSHDAPVTGIDFQSTSRSRAPEFDTPVDARRQEQIGKVNGALERVEVDTGDATVRQRSATPADKQRTFRPFTLSKRQMTMCMMLDGIQARWTVYFPVSRARV
jgi:hypothetical protein